MIDLDNLGYYASQAKGIAFDGCHKIYVLMDYEQVEQMRSYGYGVDTETRLILRGEITPDEMTAKLVRWYEASCMLRFIEAVSTHATDPNLGFETIIGQGENQDEEDEE